MKQDYQWITFDCYGTLIDWENGISSAFERVAKMTGNSFDRNKVLSLYRKYEAQEERMYKRYREVLNRVARRICDDLMWKVPDPAFLSQSLGRWRPFADTNPALERLATHCKLGILSNVDNDLIAETRRHFTVNFDLVITAEQVSSYKPGLKHFTEAQKKIGDVKWIHAAQSYFHDIVPCSKMKIPSAWINRNQEQQNDPQVTAPLFNNVNLFAFANWIEGID